MVFPAFCGYHRRVDAGDRYGRWIARRPLGEGGVGEVWLCQDDKGTSGALKVLKSDTEPDELVRFQREMRALAKLRHGNIVRLLDSGSSATGAPYLVMDFVAGENLAVHIKRHGAMSEARCVEWFADLADGLAHAHANGIHHRDVKASNVLVEPSDRPILVDFGASLEDGAERVTQMGFELGTFAYMAPEVLSGGERDIVLGEVYALGMLLYESLVGELKYRGADTVPGRPSWTTVLNEKITADALDPGPGFSEGLREVVQAATAPEPEDRIQSMEDFADRLDVIRGRLTNLPPARRDAASPETSPASVPRGGPSGAAMAFSGVALGLLVVLLGIGAGALAFAGWWMLR